MNLVRRLACGLLACLLLSAQPAAAEEVPRWNPAKTRVFAVGLLEWQHPEMWPSFPAAMKNRRDEQLVHFFHQAGVPQDRIIYLKDAEATKARIVREFGKFLDRTQPGDLLVFELFQSR